MGQTRGDGVLAASAVRTVVIDKGLTRHTSTSLGQTMRRWRTVVLVVWGLAFGAANAATGATYGDWVLGSTTDGDFYAGVVNDSGAILQKRCSPSSGLCGWYLVTDTGCDKNITAPGLFSAPGGVTSINVSCVQPLVYKGKTYYQYSVNDPDLMDKMTEAHGILGIAVALQDGRFQVYRFSLKGAQQAVLKLMEGAIKARDLQQQRGTGNSTL